MLIISVNILTQLQTKAQQFKYFSLAMHKSTVTTDTVQLQIIICDIVNNFNINKNWPL